MKDACIALTAMFVVGSVPALSSLMPRAGDDIAIIPAPWASHDAALQASIQMNGAIMSISDNTGTVIVRPASGVSQHNFMMRKGVIIVRGTMPTCGEVSSAIP